jgi:osmoprotectant transport system permease protein
MENNMGGRHAIDRLGALLSLVGLAALITLPFVVFKANRIVPGRPRSLFLLFPLWEVLAFYGVLALVAVTALRSVSAKVRLAAALIGIAAVTLAIGAAGDVLTPLGNKVVRVSPGASFWVLLAVWDCWRPMPSRGCGRARQSACSFWCFSPLVVGAVLASGMLDHLSVMREYDVNASRFAERRGSTFSWRWDP